MQEVLELSTTIPSGSLSSDVIKNLEGPFFAAEARQSISRLSLDVIVSPENLEIDIDQAVHRFTSTAKTPTLKLLY